MEFILPVINYLNQSKVHLKQFAFHVKQTFHKGQTSRMVSYCLHRPSNAVV